MSSSPNLPSPLSRPLPRRLQRIAVLAAVLSVAAATHMIDLTGSAHAQAREAVRPEVAKPLKAAQDAIRAQKYKDALARVREAEAVGGRSPFETYMIDRTRGSAAMAAGDNETAGRSFEAALNSGRMAPGEQGKVEQALISLYYRAGDYPKAIVWMQRAIKDGNAGPETRALLVQSYYLSGDLARAQRELQIDLASDERAGRTPTEAQLQLSANLASRANDKAAYVTALERLVAFYPTKAYWGDLVSRVQSKPGFAERLTLDVSRLKLAIGQMSTPSEYMEMSQLALQAGYPAEGRKIVDLGFKNGVLGTGPEAARHKRLQDLAVKNVAENLKAQPKSEADANAAKDGNALVDLGYERVTLGQADAGIAMINEGIARGGLKRPDDARLHLGMAYLQAGKKADAIKAFQSVKGTDGTADLARYWIILANRPVS